MTKVVMMILVMVVATYGVATIPMTHRPNFCRQQISRFYISQIAL